ncbi:MAG: hypothetical protein ACOC78_03805, partial [Actinomycetota bacterium]
FNQHLEHLMDLAPEFGDFGKQYIAPLARGIWPKNVKRILLQIKPKIPALRRLSDERFFKVVARLAKELAPYLEPGLKQEAAVPKDVYERSRR